MFKRKRVGKYRDPLLDELEAKRRRRGKQPPSSSATVWSGSGTIDRVPLTPDEARERMLAALGAAGVNGIDTDGDDFLCASEEFAALLDALRGLAAEGVAVEIGCGWWRLSNEEIARRILAALWLDGGDERERDRALLDKVTSILRGLP